MPEITAYSTPEYDIPFWPFDAAWSCSDWITWHKKMLAEFGMRTANEKIKAAWDDQNSFEFDYNFCKYNSDFSDYFKSVGLNPNNFISDLVNNTKETVSNVSKGTASFSRLFDNKLGIGLALAAGGYVAYKYFF